MLWEARFAKRRVTIMRLLLRAVPCLLAAFLVSGAGDPPGGGGGGGIVAQRGDVRMTGADVQDILSVLDPNGRAQVTANVAALSAFVRDRVLNLAVMADLKAKAWDTRPEVTRRANEARDAVILQTYLASLVSDDPAFPAEAEVAAAYDSNKPRLAMPRQFHLAQIVLNVKPGGDAKTEEDIRKKALDLRAQATKPRADFAELARKNSQETSSAEKGGDVGWLREPDLVPAAREAVVTMSEGAVSQPVRMNDGWHIMKLMETKAAGVMALEEARPQIVQALRQQRAQRLMRAYLDEMVKAQPIQVNEIELTKQLTPGK